MRLNDFNINSLLYFYPLSCPAERDDFLLPPWGKVGLGVNRFYYEYNIELFRKPIVKTFNLI
jgi:hypothetical protein